MDVATRRGVARGVDEHVREDLFDACVIGPHPRRRRVHLHVTIGKSACGPQRRHHAAGAGREIDRAQNEKNLARHDAADVEQIVDEPFEVGDLALDDARSKVELLGRASLALDDRRSARDGRHRIAKLVAEHREKLVFRSVGGLRHCACFAFRFERPIALAHRRLEQPACPFERGQRAVHFFDPRVGKIGDAAPLGEVLGLILERLE